MAKTKTKTVYFCANCGHESPKWLGKCPNCTEWNTFTEEIIQKGNKGKTQTYGTGQAPVPQPVKEITSTSYQRIRLSSNEVNRTLGGGLVPGSLTLIGGEPGIGKSTLLLQIALQAKKLKILYVTGEESAQQIRMRADRIGIANEQCIVLTETSTQQIFRHISDIQPQLLVIDSIQTLQTDSIESSAGSISQIRECAAEFQKYAKTTATPVVLIGHITKEGAIAGPKVLEHMVDTVLYFEGERNYGYRILRTVKNRFGSTSELGIFEMRNDGLREVDNPSEILISQRDENLSGIAIAATMEGMRPMLIETQALVSSAAYGTPQRATTGFDFRRLNMLLAVLEKRVGFRLGAKDVFLNMAGGLKVDDPAIDLAVIAAILSSNEDIPIEREVCFAAEVGLSGEIRAVNRVEQRISEADKLGFKRIFVSKYNFKGFDAKKSRIEVVPCSRLEEVFRGLFG